MHSLPPSHSRFAAPLLWALAIVIAGWGLFSMVLWSWMDPFSDQWRLLPSYLDLPFPSNVAVLENGHRPILPNLLRVLDFAVLGGTQIPQLTVGVLLASATLFLLWRVLTVDRELTAGMRGLAAVCCAIAVFWLANARMLLHPHEAVHTYLVTVSVVFAAFLLPRLLRNAPFDRTAMVGVAIACLTATFSFGPGMVLFPATIATLLIGRARSSYPLIIGILLGFVVAMYLVLPGSAGVTGSLKLAPIENLAVAMRWSANAWFHAVLPFVEPEMTPLLGKAAPLFVPIAVAQFDMFGSMQSQKLPQLLAGAVAASWLLFCSISCWLSRGAPGPTAAAGLLLGWFGLGVSMLVALSRADYFLLHPEQIHANRYLPWSCLYWLGLALLAIDRSRSSAAGARMVAGVIVLATTMTLASTWGWSTWARAVEEQTSLAALDMAVGVVNTAAPFEVPPETVAAAYPLLKRARSAMFHWPATLWIGRKLDPHTLRTGKARAGIVWTLRNQLGDNGQRVIVRSRPQSDLPNDAKSNLFWLIADESGEIVGLARPRSMCDGVVLRGSLVPGASLEKLTLHPFVDGRPAKGVPLQLDVETPEQAAAGDVCRFVTPVHSVSAA